MDTEESVIKSGLMDVDQLQQLVRKQGKWLHADQDFFGVPRIGATPTPSGLQAMELKRADVVRIKDCSQARFDLFDVSCIAPAQRSSMHAVRAVCRCVTKSFTYTSLSTHSQLDVTI